jgi:carbonic anhydrase
MIPPMDCWTKGGLATFCTFWGGTVSGTTARTAALERGRALLPERLVGGYEAFLGGRFTREQDPFRHLVEAGQKPRIMLIGCCDSRVSPEVIFDAEPGELFVARNIANLVPPYAPNDDLHGTSAALAFGVMDLGVEYIVVMGHAGCGGVRAFVRGEANAGHEPLSSGDFIGKWISLIKTAAARIERAGAPHDARQFAHSHGLPSAKSKASSVFTEPISASPRARCSRSTRLAGASNPLSRGRIAPPSPGRAHRA